MGIWRWVVQNWFELVSVVGIAGGLVFDALSRRADTRTQKVANLLTITTNHREIWKEFRERPDLARVLKASANLAGEPVTLEEAEFVNAVILHLASAYYALKDGVVIKLQGLRLDVGKFIGHPVPQAVWEKTKAFQNEDFVEFVESCRRRANVDQSAR